jgi:hypothetical protein
MGPAGASTDGAANKLTASLAGDSSVQSPRAGWQLKKFVFVLPLRSCAGMDSRNVLLMNSGVLLGRAVSVLQTCTLKETENVNIRLEHAGSYLTAAPKPKTNCQHRTSTAAWMTLKVPLWLQQAATTGSLLASYRTASTRHAGSKL